MKSKQKLAKVVTLALVLGFSGTCGVMADELHLTGSDSEQTIQNRTVKGAWLEDGAKLTATNVTFVDDPTNDSTPVAGKGEVAVDGSGSTLTMNGGAINVANDYFTVEDGGTANITNATVTSGAYANNGSITLKDSTISGRALYAGNEWKDNVPLTTAEGKWGTINVSGGTANVVLIWGYDSWEDGGEGGDGGIYFKDGANVTVKGTEGLPVNGKVMTGIYATDRGVVESQKGTKADISEIHTDNHGTVNFTEAANVKAGDVYISNSAVEVWSCPDVTFGNMYISKNGYLVHAE